MAQSVGMADPAAGLRLRALEPGDEPLLYRWENDPVTWRVSGTLLPCSHGVLSRLIEEQQYDIFATRQTRLIIEAAEAGAVGSADIFELDPANRRAGIGLMIHEREQQGRGYARGAVQLLEALCFDTLGLHQIWCSIGRSNERCLKLFDGMGYERTGVRRHWLRTPQGWEDEIMFQKLAINSAGGR